MKGMNSMEIVKSDVTVVGAGMAGMCAAIAAARNGLKVVLINDRPVLGGNASSEIGVNINGAAYLGASASVYAREGGLIEEIKLRLLKNHKEDCKRTAMWDAALFDMVYGERNILLYLNTLVHDVEVEQGNVTCVKAVQLGSERQIRFESPLFIDSSGDGIVGGKAGALYMWGRESKDRFGEDYAPEKADHYTMGDTLMFFSRDMGEKVEYTPPEFAYDITKLSFFKDLGTKHRVFNYKSSKFNGLWWLEFGGQCNTIFDNDEITLELRKLVYGIWDYIKNSGKFANVETLALEYVAPVVGKRESRRFIGDHILTQQDIERKTDFSDAVAIGGWAMDVHAPKGIYDEDYATHWHFVPGIYNIPFRCLYSKNIANLMFAGRNISATHVAFGSTRVMATGGCMGQAVGTAAVLCKKYGVLPAQIVPSHYEELADLLQKDDQSIMGRKEKSNWDLMEGLQMSASSTKEMCNCKAEDVLKLDNGICLAVPVVADKLDSLKVKVKNYTDIEQKLSIEILGGERPENYIPTDKIKDLELRVPASYDEWMSIPVSCWRPGDSKVYIVFEANSNLGLYDTSDQLTGVVSFKYSRRQLTKNDKRIAELKRIDQNICFKDVLPVQNIYGVENILNGFSRPYGLPNLWISGDESASSRPYIEMDFNAPKNINEIHLLFSTALEADHHHEEIKQLVKDYDIEVTEESGSKSVIHIKDNYLRLNKHKIERKKVKGLKFIFKSTYGSSYTEVYSVKLF